MAAMAALLAHGVALTNASLSADEGLLVVRPGIGALSSGRPVMALVKAATTDLMPLPFWNTALAMILLLLAGTAFAFLLMRAAAQAEGHRAAVTVFLVVFTTLPLTAFMLMWGEVSIAFAFGLGLAAMAATFAWLWAAEGWGTTAALAAVVMALFTALTYQAQVFVALAGVLAANIAFDLRPERRSIPTPETICASACGWLGRSPSAARSAGRWRSPWSRMGRAARTTTPAFSRGAALMPSPSSRISWSRWSRTRRGRASSVVGSWLPTLVVAVALLLQLAADAFRGSSWWNVVLLLGLLLTPFGASIALGTALPQRAMHAMPLAAGAVWLLWAIIFRRNGLRTGILVVATILLTVWHSGVTSHLYYVELTTFDTDRLIASAVAERLTGQG